MRIKQLFFLLFVCIAITQISCKKDSGSGGSITSSIVGKWTMQTIRMKVTAPSSSSTPSSDETEPGYGVTYDYRSGGQAEYCYEPDDCITLFYKINGNTLSTSGTSNFTESENSTIL